jgi:hypothetical protein
MQQSTIPYSLVEEEVQMEPAGFERCCSDTIPVRAIHRLVHQGFSIFDRVLFSDHQTFFICEDNLVCSSKDLSSKGDVTSKKSRSNNLLEIVGCLRVQVGGVAGIARANNDSW